MLPMRLLITSCLSLVLSLGAAAAVHAQTTVEVGDYVLHANAIPTLTLSPEVARASGITRSAKRGLLNIAIRHTQADGSDRAAKASVSADAINFSGQRQVLSLREVRDGEAIYYLAEPRIDEGEALSFEISARPEGSAEVLQARFKQTFFSPLPR